MAASKGKSFPTSKASFAREMGAFAMIFPAMPSDVFINSSSGTTLLTNPILWAVWASTISPVRMISSAIAHFGAGIQRLRLAPVGSRETFLSVKGSQACNRKGTLFRLKRLHGTCRSRTHAGVFRIFLKGLLSYRSRLTLPPLQSPEGCKGHRWWKEPYTLIHLRSSV